MSDGIYETVPSVPGWSAAPHHTSSKALPVPSKAAIDSYISTHPEPPRVQRPSLPEDAVVRPPLPPPRQRSSNSESEISCSPKHAGAGLLLNRGKSVKGTPDRIPTTSGAIRKSPSASSVDSTELSLTAFVDKYSSSFPQRVKVTKGFYGVSDQTAITTGDHYNFHFLKHTTVVLATDAKGMEYSLPLKSSLKLALLYDPTNGSEDTKRGTVFDTVADLLNAKVLPRVVAATRQFSGGGQESSVDPNEVLVLLGPVGAGGKMASKGKRQLKVHSVTHNVSKTLPENCSCSFTTSARSTGASLYKLGLQKEWLPVKAIVCPNDNDEGNGAESASVLTDLDHASLTLVSIREETTIVATGAAGDPSEVLEVIELPKNLDIEVELLPINAAEMSGLITNTQNRYDAFTPTSVIYYTNKPTPKLYDIQCALYKTMAGVKEEFQRMLVKPSVFGAGQRRGSMADKTKTEVDDVLPALYGVNINTTTCDTSARPEAYASLRSSNVMSAELPKRLDTLPSPESSLQGLKSCDTSARPEAYASVYDRRTNVISAADLPKRPEAMPLDSVNPPEHFQEYVTMTPTNDSPEGVTLTNLQWRISRLEENRKEYERSTQEKILKISKELGQLSDKLAQVLESSDGVMRYCSQLQQDVDRMKAEPQYSTTYHPGPRPNGKVNGHIAYGTSPPSLNDSSFPPDPKADERNREYLLSMDVDKVLKLLDCMSLSQYQEAFLKEQINGEILSECDETMLQNDLGVVSKLHRMRLIKVISGRHSAKSLLDGGDPYAGRFVSRS